MKAKISLGVTLITLILLACVCISSSDIGIDTPEAFELEQPQIQATATEEPEATSIPTVTATLEPTPTEKPSQTSEPSPTIEPLVDVFSTLGKSADEVDSIIGTTVLITPIEDAGDDFAGGEFRDYELGSIVVFVTYDSSGISRVFQVLYGLSDENYSLGDWNLILPKFGVNPMSPPDRKFPAAIYWDNYDGYDIVLIASNTSGKPVWSVKISEAGLRP